MIYIIIAILMFGVLIAVHELGHFSAAKLLGVKVNEYSIGMGPALFKKQGKNTLYSLRILPIGGYCALEGEDGDSDDPKAFSSQSLWKKIIILVAGPFMNFLVGFIIVLVLYSGAKGFVTTTIDTVADPVALPQLQEGDRIKRIDGNRILLYSDISLFLSRGDDDYYDLIVERDSKDVKLNHVNLTIHDFEYNGQAVQGLGFVFKLRPANVLNKIEMAFKGSMQFVRMVKMGLSDLITGRAGLKDMSGPVGIVSVITEVGEEAENAKQAAEDIAYLCAFIAVNLAVMNLLPIPAIDGGRIFLLIVTWIIEKLIRRKVNPKIETYIHAAGLVIMMGLMAVILFSDVLKLIKR